ncbi:FecR family protein [Paraflavitalea pollutisoli]|uniref:FecR family protein n=1 Tax=Paraflavitalea pollutisoli TaxID=3034143 RepID=UPI0023EBCC5F|nr:FecR family protein [Paraflavitalea sp. H1-2-19X]
MQQQNTPWIGVWNEPLTVAEKKQLLATFLEQEADWKAMLETAFLEDVQQQRQYLPTGRTELLLTLLHTKIRQEARLQAPARVVRFSSIGKWIAAAAVLAVVGMTIYWFRPQSGGHPSTPAELATNDQQLHTITNRTKTDSLIRMEDGSLVTLAVGSTIRFYQPYKNNLRDISLDGQALFKVAKDSLRPFTVYAGGIATTALGTQFLVTTLEQHTVAVRLYEGKVAIHQAAGGPSMKEVVLKPGEEFSLDQLLHQCSVRPFKQINTTIPESDPIEQKTIKPRTSVRALEFAQEPLPLVLTAIGKRYHVHFVYDEASLSNEQVTGKFLSSDSLSTVLSILGTVNKLTFTHQDGSIVVKKSE